MRLFSLRKKMEEWAKNPPSPPPPPDPHRPREKSLVDKLCEGKHSVDAGLRLERRVKHSKETIDRGYIHLSYLIRKMALSELTRNSVLGDRVIVEDGPLKIS